MNVAETKRLIIRHFNLDDAEFILRLLNEPTFIENIADKGVRTLDDARGYISNSAISSYEKHGFGLFLVSIKSDNTPIGMCGLINREVLDDIDVGYALLPEFTSNGYASESVVGVLKLGKEKFGLNRVAALVNPENTKSIRLLINLGFKFEKMTRLSKDENEINLYALDMT